MKDDLLKFENRSDDWLAKQRAYEDKVSAWDIDEGKRIKLEHTKAHRAYNLQQKINKDNVKDLKNINPGLKATTAISIAILLIIFIISFMLMILGY